MSEPTYLRFARRLMDVFSPSGIDGFLLGLVVSLGFAVITALYLTGN